MLLTALISSVTSKNFRSLHTECFASSYCIFENGKLIFAGRGGEAIFLNIQGALVYMQRHTHHCFIILVYMLIYIPLTAPHFNAH